MLVWNFLIFSAIVHLIADNNNFTEVYLLIVGLTLPFAGWLADICFGRYEMIRWSMWIMWTASMLATASSIVAQFVESYQNINKEIRLVLNIMVCIGCGGYQANAVLFGLDQLQDASTDEITAFIIWYVWTAICGSLAYLFVNEYLSKEYQLIVPLLECVCLSIVVSLCDLFHNVLLKEPVTQNPFQLVYKVIRYAINNKHPICRSAFTYCEDELPSRIDFGKSKYGGPFTTEQVEDVKTFLRLIIAIIFFSLLLGGIAPLHQLQQKYVELLEYSNQTDTEIIRGIFAFCNTVVLIPLYEFVFYPLFQRKLLWVQSYHKLILGVLLHTVRIITLMAFELSTRHTYLVQHGDNATLQCILKGAQDNLSLSFNAKWMALPDFLLIMSTVFFIFGSFEFMCAQSPYSMRGLLFGTGYGSVVLFNILGYGIMQPFIRLPFRWGSGIISCEFWLLLLILILLIISTVLFCGIIKWYKKRKREDVLPNEHIFAERYYTS